MNIATVRTMRIHVAFMCKNVILELENALFDTKLEKKNQYTYIVIFLIKEYFQR